MKENKIRNIIILTSIIVIIVGIIITVIFGFNFELLYQDTKKVELYLNKEFKISDIKQITNEVLNNKNVIIQKVEVFEDSVSIIAKDISDEEKNSLVTKINEKYGTDLKSDNIKILSIPHTRGRDIVKPYLLPYLIATLIIIVYMAIRYIKINSLKAILKLIVSLILAQGVLFSLISITRLPISRITMPISIVVYILTLLFVTNNLEKELELNKEDNTEK